MMKLIVISPEEDFAHENKAVEVMLSEGLQYFHLRKPAYDREQMGQYINRIPAKFHNKIIMHSHHELAMERGLKGVHYNNKNLQRKISAQKIHESISCHSQEEIRNNNYSFDYIFLSPVFNSISKPGYKGIANFEKIERNGITSIIALGGIDVDKIEKAKQFNFDGVAVLGALWNKNSDANSIVKKFKQLQNLCNQ